MTGELAPPVPPSPPSPAPPMEVDFAPEDPAGAPILPVHAASSVQNQSAAHVVSNFMSTPGWKPLSERRLINAELRDRRDAARVRDDQRDPAGRHGADPMQFAFTDGRAARDGRPDAVRLGFEVMLRDPLTERDGLLNAHEVEGTRLTEIELEPRADRPLPGRPERVELAIDRHGRRAARLVLEDGIGERRARRGQVALV